MIIDLIVIVILALSIFLGYKQGLIKMIIKILAFFIAIAVSLLLYKTVANIIINNTKADENIQEAIISKFVSEEELKGGILPKALIEAGKNTGESIANTISIKIIEFASLIIIFIVVRIVLIFITLLADLIAKIPVIKQFNEVGGIIFGAIRGVLFIFIAFAVISLLSPVIGENIINMINNSLISAYIYNNNILFNIIG